MEMKALSMDSDIIVKKDELEQVTGVYEVKWEEIWEWVPLLWL
jgi:hypothetical protein